MLRRTFMVSASAALLVPTLGLPALAQTPRPALFVHEMFHRLRCCMDGQTLGGKMRDMLLRQMQGKLVPAVRNSMTKRQLLQTQYTLEMAYDGVPPGDYGTEIAQMITSEMAAELEAMTPLSLVAVDTAGVKIDAYTFQPFIEFYADYNS